MEEQKYSKGDHVRIDGDGTEYEVVNINGSKITLQPKYELDAAKPERVTAKTEGQGDEDLSE
jgi:hypothetical protein